MHSFNDYLIDITGLDVFEILDLFWKRRIDPKIVKAMFYLIDVDGDHAVSPTEVAKAVGHNCYTLNDGYTEEPFVAYFKRVLRFLARLRHNGNSAFTVAKTLYKQRVDVYIVRPDAELTGHLLATGYTLLSEEERALYRAKDLVAYAALWLYHKGEERMATILDYCDAYKTINAVANVRRLVRATQRAFERANLNVVVSGAITKKKELNLDDVWMFWAESAEHSWKCG